MPQTPDIVPVDTKILWYQSVTHDVSIIQMCVCTDDSKRMNIDYSLHNIIMAQKLKDTVQDGIDYFETFRLEELKMVDQFYIEAFIKYICIKDAKNYQLQNEIKRLRHETSI